MCFCVQANTCFIDNTCHVGGELNPHDVRWACKPGINQDQWSVIGTSYPLGKFALTGCGGIIDLMGLGTITSVNNTIIVSGPDNTENGATMFTGTAESQVKIENIAKLDTMYSLSIFLNLYAEESGSVLNYGTDRGVGLYYNEMSGEIVFRVVKRNNADLISEVKAKVNAKKWYHVGGTYDYNTGKTCLYIDNKLGAVSDTPTKDMLATDSTIYLGAIEGVTLKFKGRVSCLHMFDRVIEEAEIDNLKKCKLNFFMLVSEYPSLPKLPEIELVRRVNATANGTDDFSVFSLKCDVSTGKETHVKYELQWIINGAISKTNTFVSSDATGGKFESVLSGDSLKSLQKIDQVSSLQNAVI
ncbi:hypothetical protein NP493_1334g01008 [Ridgeia piscesae]|uniref:LamG domain-containing protein n=1 Tax=Ridgeia piscesae TaxID=27915 RepID=A0AAD9K707_RIDPI|nr:hypothetical protein NP493_1334g01008 [Ridgeia piscesae]